LEEREKQVFVLIEYQGSYNIGAFIRASNKYVLVPPDLEDKYVTAIERVMNAPVYKLEIMESPLLGLYVVGNSHGVILPHDASDDDVKLFKETLNLPVERVKFVGYENALANIFLVNDKGGVVHSKFFERNKENIKIIEDVLDIEIVPHDFSFDVVGSACVATNKGCLCHPLMKEDELCVISDVLKVNAIAQGSVNMGMGFIGIGMVANDSGIIAGLKTTGIELSRAYTVLVLGRTI